MSFFDRLFNRGPSEFNLQINGPETTVRVQAKESLLNAALNQGLSFPHNCRVGGCGQCKCRLVSGKVKELTDKSYLRSAEGLQQNYSLACQAQPRSDVVIEVSMQAGAGTPAKETGARIVSLKPLTHDILHVVLALDEVLKYNAGQCLDIVVPSAAGGPEGCTRSYSLASAPRPEHGNQVEFFIRKVPGGLFTPWLFEQAKPGERLTVRGPVGTFGLVPGKQPLLCIAGGSGLAPIKAMLEQAIHDGQLYRPVMLLLGARTQIDIYALEEIEHLRKQWAARCHYEAVLSAEPESSNWTGRRGFVSDVLEAVLGTELPKQDVYLCGPPPMIDTCEAALIGAGVPRQNIHADRFLDASYQAPGKAA